MSKNLKFDLNLQKLATLCVAEQLWENPLIKIEVKKSMPEKNPQPGVELYSKEWTRIRVKVTRLLNSLKLPATLSTEIRKIIILIGEKICIWICNIAYKNCGFQRSQKLYWTTYGVIDEIKVYRDWMKNPCFQSMNDPMLNRMVLYSTACIYADEKFIAQSLNSIAEVLEATLGLKVKNSNFKVNSAMTVLLIWSVAEQKQSKFKELYSNLKSREYSTGSDKLFGYCVLAGYKDAAEYFYKKLKEKDRAEILQESVSGIITLEEANQGHRNHYVERRPELLLFLLNKMSPDGRKKCLKKYILGIHFIFLSTWPYQDLCPQIINFVWNDLSYEKKQEIFQSTLNMTKDVVKNLHDFRTEFFHPVLRTLLRRASKKFKLEFFLADNNNYILFLLFEVSNFSSIKIIVNDPDLIKYKLPLLDFNQYMADYLTRGKSPEKFKSFMEEMELSDEDKKDLIQFCTEDSLIRSLLCDGYVNSADEVLKWQCELSGEGVTDRKKTIRKSLNVEEVCFIMVKSEKYSSIENVLNWLYDGDQEGLKNIKTKIFSPDFIREKFWHVYIKTYNSYRYGQSKCTEYLKYFLKTDEKVESFKKTKLLENEYFLKILAELCDWPQIDEVLIIAFGGLVEYCSVSEDKMNEIKRKVKDNIDWWFKTYAVRGKKFLVLHSILYWIANEDHVEVREMIRNYMSSPYKAALTCVQVCRLQDRDRNYEARQTLLLHWVRPRGNVEEIKEEVRKLAADGSVTRNDVLEVGTFLDRLETEFS